MSLHQICLIGDIDYGMLLYFCDQVSKVKLDGDDKVKVVISSEGGDCYVAFAIYDTLRKLSNRSKDNTFGTTIETLATGGVMSAAAQILLQAGDHRVASKNASIMVHYGTEASESPSGVKENKRITKLMNDVLIERTGASRRTVNGWMKTDTWFTPEEALKKGLIDEVLS